MKAEQISVLLGRPLTSPETSNFDTYLKIANQTLEQLLCTSVCDQDDPKIYDSRVGYSTVFTDIFTDIDEVKVDGEVVEAEDYSKRQWDRRNGRWFNSIVFEDRFRYPQEIEVSATWGFVTMPSDLQVVVARLFDLVTKKNKFDPRVSSKRIEDYSVSFKETELDNEFYKQHALVLSKYAQCDIPYIRHGKIYDLR